MFKVNNKVNGIFQNIFYTFPSFSIADFEQLNVLLG